MALPGDKVEIHLNSKIYKSIITNKIRIFPGDPSGSPDDFFLRNYLKCWEFF